MSTADGRAADAAELGRLREEVARLRTLIAHGENPVWCFLLDPPAPVELGEDELVRRILASRLVEANPPTASVFAREDVGEILGLSMTEVSVAPLEDLEKRVRAFVQRGFTLGEARFDRAAGGGLRRVRHQVLGSVRDGCLEALWGTSSDRTEHARAESELERERSLVEAILHTSVAAIVVMDPEGRIVVANPAAESILGLSRDRILERTYDAPEWRSTDVEGRPIADADLPFRRALAGPGPIHDVRMAIEWPDGTRKLLSVDAGAIRDAARRPVAVVASIVDVTERERAAEALRQSEEFLRLALDGARMGTWRWDVGEDAVVWSERTAAIFGRTLDQAPRDFEAYLAMVHPEDREHVRREVSAAIEGRSGDYLIEHRVPWPDGSVHWLEARGRVHRDAQGRVLRMTGVAMDTDERRRLQEHVERTARVESIGRLAGGVAHDFNNLLTAVLGYGELALGTLRPRDPARDSLERALEAAQRGAALTRQLLAFARQQPARDEVLELNPLVEGVVRLLPRLLGEQIEVVARLGEGLAPIRADAGQVEQILVNLAVNARDAMGGRGRLLVQTWAEELSSEQARRHPDACEGRFVVLSVRDEGAGMPPEVVARIFEPFFTTKPIGEGTGLGLSTAYGVARQHGGWIEVDSAPGAGTTFRVVLPVTDEAPGRAPGAPATSPGAGRGELLLVVEDDPAIRALLSDSLPALGYDLLLAADGQEALAAARAHPRKVDLLVTDLVMPRMGGRELAETLRRDRPGLRVLYASGYDAEGELHGRLERREAFLPKPYTPAVLARRVRALLEEG